MSKLSNKLSRAKPALDRERSEYELATEPTSRNRRHQATVVLLVGGPVIGAVAFWLTPWSWLALIAVLIMNGGALALWRRDRHEAAAFRESIRAHQTETRAIVETAPDGIVTVDRDGVIHSANRAAGKIFGVSNDKLIGSQLSDLVLSIAEAQRSSGDNTTNILMTRGTEHRALGSDGEEFPLEVNMSFMPRGAGKAGMVLVFRDITERKQVERRLRAARDRALVASRAKSQFLANMSHELRTPLNAVIGYSDLIREDLEFTRAEGSQIDPDTLTADIDRIGTAGRHLLSLVDDILDLSKIEAGQMQVDNRQFDVQRLLDEISSTIGPLAAKNSNRFVLDVVQPIGFMQSDETKVRQILLNLLSNACKFTTEGTVRLLVHRQRGPDGAKMVFEVSDTGIGMSEDQLERVFDAFTQADNSSTREFGGTGLGLTISSHFCKLLGGDIEVTSTPGEGTTFIVHLDAGPSEIADMLHSADMLPRVSRQAGERTHES